MKNIALGAALVLTFMSWSAVADEQGTMQAKAPTEEQCKAMAEQHGMKGDDSDAWVKKCMEMSNDMKSDRGTGENDDMQDKNDSNDMGDMNDMNNMDDGNDMRDPEDGDSGMSGDDDK